MEKRNLDSYDVMFYRKGKNYFFKYEGNEFLVNSINMNSLKSVLKLPYMIKFYGLSKAQVTRTLRDILDKNMDFKLYKMKKGGSNISEYVLQLSEKKNLIYAYMVPKTNEIYDTTNKINPYLLTKINKKRILMEVTKDFMKTNEGDYYFLAKDLTKEEKKILYNYYTKIECDYFYKLSDYSNEKTNKTKKR